MNTTSLVLRSARQGAWLAVLLALGGCAMLFPSRQTSDSFLGMITPYRMDIVQGNVVTQEQAALVKPGMSRAQVRDVLGSPMLTDLFHVDRWDYIFTIKRQGTAPQRRNVIAYFDGDKLDRIEAADLPSEREFVAAISRPLANRALPMIALTEAQKKALPPPPKAAAEPVVPMGALRSYPPLEP